METFNLIVEEKNYFKLKQNKVFYTRAATTEVARRAAK